MLAAILSLPQLLIMSKRLTRVYRVVAAFLTAASLVACTTTGAASHFRHARLERHTAIPQTPDEIFVALRNAALDNDVARATELAEHLHDYPIQSYVQYFQIRPQMFDSQGKALVDAPDDIIRAFLSKYRGRAIADRLRNDWLLVLGKRHDWKTFDAQYAKFVLNDDTQVKCYALMSRASRGEQVGVLARDLLVHPRYFGEGCVDMINMLAQMKQLTPDDVWFQIRQAYESNYVTLGKQIADALGDQRPDDALLDMAANRPTQLLARGIQDTDASRQLALLAITRMARNSPALASASLGEISAYLSPQERQAGWGEIGYQAALELDPQALDWYRRSGDVRLSFPAQQWKVRAALRAGDWTAVRSAIEQLAPELRGDSVWIYWYGRALSATGQPEAARKQFERISNQYNFYGQLALEALGGKITIPPRTTVTPAEVDAMRNVPGFLRAEKLYALNLRLEGNREWNWELRRMDDSQLLAAAEYAKSIELYDRAVNTADRTRTEQDFTLRYLMPFRSAMERNAAAVDLDPAWAYGLIRQESRFIINASSTVGASGLMQLMPGTARLVARKIGIDYNPSAIHDINTNLLLGTNYLSMIYNQFDGSAVLASAGYNAGPRRPLNWRATLTRPVEGAIFAETIPFNETRIYVENVLSNTTYYAALISGKPQSLKARLGTVFPQ